MVPFVRPTSTGVTWTTSKVTFPFSFQETIFYAWLIGVFQFSGLFFFFFFFSKRVELLAVPGGYSMNLNLGRNYGKNDNGTEKPLLQALKVLIYIHSDWFSSSILIINRSPKQFYAFNFCFQNFDYFSLIKPSGVISIWKPSSVEKSPNCLIQANFVVFSFLHPK